MQVQPSKVFAECRATRPFLALCSPHPGRNSPLATGPARTRTLPGLRMSKSAACWMNPRKRAIRLAASAGETSKWLDARSKAIEQTESQQNQLVSDLSNHELCSVWQKAQLVCGSAGQQTSTHTLNEQHAVEKTWCLAPNSPNCNGRGAAGGCGLE